MVFYFGWLLLAIHWMKFLGVFQYTFMVQDSHYRTICIVTGRSICQHFSCIAASRMYVPHACTIVSMEKQLSGLHHNSSTHPEWNGLTCKTVESSDSLFFNKTNSERGWSQFINKRTKKYHKDMCVQLKQLHHEQKQWKSPPESTGRLGNPKITQLSNKVNFSQAIFQWKNIKSSINFYIYFRWILPSPKWCQMTYLLIIINVKL